MPYEITTKLALANNALVPLVTSYDSGEEHSLEHYFSVKALVAQEDEELREVPATFALTASAS